MVYTVTKLQAALLGDRIPPTILLRSTLHVLKGPERDADHSHSFCGEFCNAWSYTIIFSTCCHDRHGNYFTYRMFSLHTLQKTSNKAYIYFLQMYLYIYIYIYVFKEILKYVYSRPCTILCWCNSYFRISRYWYY